MEAFERFLQTYTAGDDRLSSAMRYSLCAGGKRLRPRLVFLASASFGGSEPMHYAAAIEAVHTYSLIHDDLPCMDDDDLRRGMPTCHKQFDEATAVLAGDGLLTTAFSLITAAPLSDEQNVRAVRVLAECAGERGMVRGQVIDMTLHNGTQEQIMEMYKYKTGALLRAAVALGVIAAGGRGNELESFADNLGKAFQIRDDILDVEGDEKLLGKPIGSDAKNEKNTILTVISLEEAKKAVQMYTDRAIAAVTFLGKAGDPLAALAASLTDRKV